MDATRLLRYDGYAASSSNEIMTSYISLPSWFCWIIQHTVMNTYASHFKKWSRVNCGQSRVCRLCVGGVQEQFWSVPDVLTVITNCVSVLWDFCATFNASPS